MRKISIIIFIVLLIMCFPLQFFGLLSVSSSDSIEFTPNVKVNDFNGSASGRPSIAVGNNGYIYVVMTDNSNDNIYFSKSINGGQTFGSNVKVNDNSVGATNGCVNVAIDKDDNIYVAWHDNRNGWHDYDIYFARSTDGGLTFSKNIKVNDGPAGSWDSLPSMTVDDNGTIYIAWSDQRADIDYDIYFAKSTDKGMSFNPNVKVNDDNNTRQGDSSIAVDNHGNIYVAWRDYRNGWYDQDIYFARSIDGGQTFETNLRVNDDTSGQAQWCPSISVDLDNKIYVAWGDYRESRPQNVYFARSIDMGMSFEANIRVNDEKSKLQLGAGFPSISANEKDNICVVWQDGRNTSNMYDIYFARSTDGGLSFNQNIIVNDDNKGVYQGSPSITLDSNGTPHIVWIDKRDGISNIYFAKGISRPNILTTIDIDPNTLNLKSKGRWITCYITLNDPYDVNDIDISTILLEDTIPAEWGDIQGDTLMVKFDRSEVEDMLSPGAYNLKVTGELTDGTSLEGYSDEIRVIDPGK